MTELRRIAERHGLALVVDAAQAAGAKFLGRTGNTIGDAAAFSFYPTKNMGALGDGGAIVTPDASLAEKIRKLRN
jgi:dTDP-4-amino-4,6-dideoxygalactose transaminase